MKRAFISFTSKMRRVAESRSVHLEGLEGRLLLSSYSAVANFSTAANPNPPWSYGETSGSGFALDSANPANSEYFGAGTMGSTSSIALPSGAQTLQMQPGATGTSADLRWTAPSSGTFSVIGNFASTTGGTENVHLDLNGTSLVTAQLAPSGVMSLPIDQSSVTVHAGDTIDFIVGAGTGGYSTLDQATLTATIAPAGSTGTNTSPLLTTVTGKIPTKSLVSGQRIMPFTQFVTLTNSGSSRVNGPVTIGLVLGNTPTGETGDAVVGTLSRRINLGPAKSIKFPILVKTIPANTTGTFYLVAKVTDPNGLASSGGSSGTISTSAPNIELTGAFRVVPALARAGHNVSIPVIISNQGNIQAKGTLTIDIVATGATSTVALGPTAKHILIKPQGRQILDLIVKVPPDAAADTYTLSGAVDPNDLFNSSTFTGNTFASSSTFRIVA